MNLKNISFCLAIISFASCSHTLLNPLEGGKYYFGQMPGDSPRSMLDAGSELYLKPHKFFKVRAVENSWIQRVFVNYDSNVSILAKGKFDVAYGGLFLCFVKAGSWVQKGQIIGELKSSESKSSNLLNMSIRKDSIHVKPNW